MDLITYALCKNSGADAASAAASSASAAQAAQRAAETARDTAKSAQSAAEAARDAASGSAQGAASSAIAASDSAEDAQGYADDAQSSAQDAQTSAGNAQTAAGQAAGSATTAQGHASAAQTARAGAESAQSAAVTAQGLAEDAQDAAETARDAAQSAQSAAESAKSGAEAAKSGAETAKTAAETAAGNASDDADAAASSASAAAQSAQAAQEAAQTALEIIDDEAVAADSTWSSKQIIDTLCPPLEETGNPVQCYPVAGYPLGVKARWEPRQGGSGDPSPENVRPITGMDSLQVTQCGKNLLDVGEITGIVWANDRPSASKILNTFNNLPVGEYRFTADIRIDSVEDTISSTRELLYGIIVRNSQDINNSAAVDRNSLGVGNVPSVGDILRVNMKVLIKPEYAGTYDQIFLYSPGSDNRVDRTSGTMYNFQLELGSIPTAYEPYTGTTATLTLPETIYGGTVDAVTGVGMEEWEYMEFDGTEGWQMSANNIVLYNAVTSPSNTNPGTGYCSHFPFAYNYGGNNIFISVATVCLGRVLTANYTLESWKSYLTAQKAAGTPVTICYKLATPQPIQATGSQPLPVLSGQNVLITNADSLTVTGRADPNHTIQTLSDRIAALESNTTQIQEV